MTASEEIRPDERAPRRFTTQRKFAAAGLAAGLLGGGAAGMLMTNSPLSSAATASVSQAEDPPADTGEEVAGDESRREAHLGEVLAPLVENGTIDQGQADAVIAALLEAAPDRPMGRRGRAWVSFKAAAEAIGIEPRELAASLRDGSTIAEVATEHGVEVQAVIDAMVAEAKQRLDEAVADGRITAEEAAERLAKLTERITEGVNDGFRRHPHGDDSGSGSSDGADDGASEGGDGGA